MTIEDWSNPQSIQAIYDACKAKEKKGERLKTTEVFGETQRGLLVRATYFDEEFNTVSRVVRIEVMK